MHPTSVLVKYGTRTTAATSATVLTAANLRVVREFHPATRWAVLDLPPQTPRPVAGQEAQALRDRITQLRQSGQFEYVEPDYVRQISAAPSDTFFQDGSLWGLRNVGQAGGVRGADLNLTNAWDITVGSTNVIVAVLDSGVRYTHLDLAAQMWRNPGEIPGDGIDNDGDGFVDNLFGINAITGSGDPNDDNGHGTHVAGTIGAAANNGQPHVGVAWNVRLMAVKAGDALGNLPSSAIIAGVDFAISKGAKIINCSFGGFQRSVAEEAAFLRARDAGVLVVAAAGNSRNDNDIFPAFPASFAFDNIIAVAALDRRDGLASFSSFGRTNVHVGAPGVEILSTYNTADNAYRLLNGTSMAAPHIAGVAALVFSLTNTMTYSEVRNRLLFTTTPVPALASITSTGGRVNAHRALTTAGDNLLEVLLTPSSGSTLLAGATVPITVEVNDLLPVTNATVIGTIPGLFTNVVFINNGSAPDTISGDNRQSININVPATATVLTLDLTVLAPGKTNFTASFTFRTETVPSNNNFPPLAKVPDNGAVLYGDNTFATMEFGEPVHAGVSSVANSVWWNFAPTNSKVVLVDTSGSSFDTVVAIYTGNSLTNLTLIAAANDVTVTNNGQTTILPQGFVSFAAVAGTTYRLVVASASTNSVGQIRLRVRFDGVPDTLAPIVAITNMISGPLSVTNPPSGQIVTNAALTLSGTAIDPTTDAIGVSQVLVRLNSSLSTAASGTNDWTIPLFLTAGTNVIQVSAVDFSGNISAPVTFQVTYRVFDPFNDVLANALELPGVFGTVTTNSANATIEPGEPRHVDKQGGKSVWYYFIAPADGQLLLSTTNSTFDTLLAIYTGTRVDRLTAINANDDAPVVGGAIHSELLQAVRTGERYLVAVDGLSGASGQIFLTYSFTPATIHSLTVTASAGGAVFPASGSFVSSSVVNVAAVASNGFNFVAWSGDSLALDNPLRITVSRNTSLTALFAPVLLADSFESGALRPNIGWATNNAAGIAPWAVQAASGSATNAATGGAFHVRSGAITNGQTTILRLVANCRAGGGAFGYRVSTEEFGPAIGDFFEFYLNGIRQVRTNGESGWLTHTFTVPAGGNTLEWRYIKDASFSGNLDAVFLDSVDVPFIEPVNLTVPVRVTTNSLQLVSGGGVQFRIEGQTNQVYHVQASADLANWLTISTNFAPYGLIQFTDPQATTNASRYYRIILP
ncbi:MAG: S8 family serine peptidase [Verrucomicrobia bacterium]|nr:S8 family serine peptidase [Verrucomicrobiota bacterium]